MESAQYLVGARHAAGLKAMVRQTALTPHATRGYSSGLLNSAAYSPEGKERNRRYRSARLEWVGPIRPL